MIELPPPPAWLMWLTIAILAVYWGYHIYDKTMRAFWWVWGEIDEYLWMRGEIKKRDRHE